RRGGRLSIDRGRSHQFGSAGGHRDSGVGEPLRSRRQGTHDPRPDVTRAPSWFFAYWPRESFSMMQLLTHVILPVLLAVAIVVAWMTISRSDRARSRLQPLPVRARRPRN